MVQPKPLSLEETRIGVRMPGPTAGAAVVSAATEAGTDSEDSGGVEDCVDISVASVEAVTSVMESLEAGAELDSGRAFLLTED